MDIHIILRKLYQGSILSQAESYKLFSSIITGKLEDPQIAAALIAMKVRGECTHEIVGAVSALLDHAHFFPRPEYIFADIAGTGGDGSNSINISTASAFVAAVCGLKIAKHGNHSISSQSGSADLLASFGINLNISSQKARQALDELNICFLFAPQYHSGFFHTMAVRKILNISTIFNVIGPLINPAHPPLALIGVYSKKLLFLVAQTLKMIGYQRAAVVHSGGMDEVALHSTTHVAELKDGKIISYQLTPKDFGLNYHPAEELTGGTPEQNRDTLALLLQGKGKLAHEESVAANVALLMKIFGYEDLRQNAKKALKTIRQGHTYKHITALAVKG